MTKNTTKKLNKSAWIRKQAKKLKAAEVVAKAKAEGIALSIAQVYTARSTAKAKIGVPTRSVGRPRKDSVITDMHKQFMALVVRIGTDEAQRLVELAAEGKPAAEKVAPVKAPKVVAVVSNGVAQA
jgi:hypothetical protein